MDTIGIHLFSLNIRKGEYMLFEKAIVFGDIHFGEKQNSREHNEDCIEYLKWLVSTAKRKGIKTAIFLGDWHHSRRAINVETLHYSVKGLNLLNDYFDHVYFLEGNHDLFYRESREISSVSLAGNLDAIQVISEPLIKKDKDGDVAFIPWLVGDEWKDLKGKKYKYVFGHFELPHFLLNAMITMPDTGELNNEAFVNCDYVFTGHFHKRQQKDNVIYIGNPFAHNFNDVDDKERGLMVLEWDKEPKFIDWKNATSYRRWNLEDLKNDADSVIGNDKKIYAEITYPAAMSYVQAANIRDDLLGRYDFRSITLKKEKEEVSEEGEEIKTETVKSVDSVVIEQIKTIDSPSYDINMLIEEYNSLSSYDSK